MSEEFKRMVELAGLPTPETTTEENTTESLNENFVGIPAINNIFEREKTDYELAFEHFTKGTSLNEEMEDEDEFDLNQAFKNSPETAPYEDVLGVIESYEDEDILNDFKTEFPEGEPVNKRDYSDFSISLIDDMSEVDFIQANWISIFDEDIFDKAGLNESNKPGTFKQRSAMAKKARAGKDIGEKGKNFKKIAKSAAKKYGSEEAGKKVAGAVMYGKLNK